jgi:hypothetical protein
MRRPAFTRSALLPVPGSSNLLGCLPQSRQRAVGRMLALAACALAVMARAEDPDPLVGPDHRLAPEDPAWVELAGDLRQQSSVTAYFTESRTFFFKHTPTVLKGEVRVSAERGLSLHYLDPVEQTVINDTRGLLVRTAKGDSQPPADPQSLAANLALLSVLRLDLRPLTETFELYGRRTGAAWALALVPRSPELRRTLGQITVEGEAGRVRHIEFRRSLTQRVEIFVEPPRSFAAFTVDELRRYFR